MERDFDQPNAHFVTIPRLSMDEHSMENARRMLSWMRLKEQQRTDQLGSSHRITRKKVSTNRSIKLVVESLQGSVSIQNDI
jgi:hypothetical protein